jgi:hypothetical protein
MNRKDCRRTEGERKEVKVGSRDRKKRTKRKEERKEEKRKERTKDWKATEAKDRINGRKNVI